MAINIETNEIYGTGSKHHPIERWEVWFFIPMKGCIKDRKQAIEVCKELDWDPKEMIVPVCVAVAEGGEIFEPLMR